MTREAQQTEGASGGRWYQVLCLGLPPPSRDEDVAIHPPGFAGGGKGGGRRCYGFLQPDFTSSTRRFLARPASVALSATGWVLP